MAINLLLLLQYFLSISAEQCRTVFWSFSNKKTDSYDDGTSVSYIGSEISSSWVHLESGILRLRLCTVINVCPCALKGRPDISQMTIAPLIIILEDWHLCKCKKCNNKLQVRPCNKMLQFWVFPVRDPVAPFCSSSLMVFLPPHSTFCAQWACRVLIGWFYFLWVGVEVGEHTCAQSHIHNNIWFFRWFPWAALSSVARDNKNTYTQTYTYLLVLPLASKPILILNHSELWPA